MSPMKQNKSADSGHSVPYQIAQDIKKEAEKGYYLQNELLKPIEWTIDVKWFYDNLFGWHHPTWENYGFRLYPALKENRLCLIICRSTNYNPKLEDFYFLIDTYAHQGNEVDSINSQEALTYIGNYLSKVRIDAKISGVEGYLRKTSRFYDWYLIRAYLAANGYAEVPGTDFNYKLRITFGLTDIESADLLYKIYYKQIAERAEDLLGFTAVIELLIDDDTVARQEQPGEIGLKNGIIEIGNPCPPRCHGAGFYFE